MEGVAEHGGGAELDRKALPLIGGVGRGAVRSPTATQFEFVGKASRFNMPATCPQCGAIFPDGETCGGRFDALQWKELEDPAYYAVHHIGVPCYLLQHNAYSRRGWIEVRDLLRRFLRERWTPAMARRRYHAAGEPNGQGGSLTRGEKLPGVERIVWSFTVAEVRRDSADAYGADIRRWGERVLADSENLVRAEVGCPNI